MGSKAITRKADLAYEISEAAYEVFRELTTVAYQAAQRAYPRSKRDTDENVRFAYESAHDEARSHLTNYKTLVRDKILPLVRLTKHNDPYDFWMSDFELDAKGDPVTRNAEDRPTWQLRGMVVLNALKRLHADLSRWVPPMPEPERERYIRILNDTYQESHCRLLEFLSYYEADPILAADGEHINLTD
jgi:hypothetical protein